MFTITVTQQVPVTMQWAYDEDDRTDWERIRDAFKSLRSRFHTAMARDCCGSCMMYRLGTLAEKSGKGAVGFNRQSLDAFERDEYWNDKQPTDLKRTLWLNHDGDSAAVVEALRAQGMPVYWNGDDSRSIAVLPRLSTIRAKAEAERDAAYVFGS
jgi:hypothetical protein